MKEMGVHAKSMTYTGFNDFGDTAAASNELADHGLVFTSCSFGGHYSQPITVFARKRPRKKTVPAQLVLRAILLLEAAGAFFR